MHFAGEYPVALLAEGVDRNLMKIEDTVRAAVALLAEGVDRNSKLFHDVEAYYICRPPRGGRG